MPPLWGRSGRGAGTGARSLLLVTLGTGVGGRHRSERVILTAPTAPGRSGHIQVNPGEGGLPLRQGGLSGAVRLGHRHCAWPAAGLDRGTPQPRLCWTPPGRGRHCPTGGGRRRPVAGAGLELCGARWTRR